MVLKSEKEKKKGRRKKLILLHQAMGGGVIFFFYLLRGFKKFCSLQMGDKKFDAENFQLEMQGAGKARFNVATPTNATVTCTAYVLPYNLQTKSI